MGRKFRLCLYGHITKGKKDRQSYHIVEEGSSRLLLLRDEEKKSTFGIPDNKKIFLFFSPSANSFVYSCQKKLDFFCAEADASHAF